MSSGDAAQLDDEFTRLVTESIEDPRPFYAELRERAPVYRTPFDFWYVTRYDLAVAISRDNTSWTVSRPSSMHGGHHDGFASDAMARMMLTLDGPDHARLRRLVGTIFTPRGAEALRAKVTTALETQLDGLAGRTHVDLVHDFAILLPTKVILDVLGIGHDEVERFVAVADSLIAMHEPTASEETLEEADRVFREAADVVLELAERRRAAPEDDLLTALVEARDNTDRLDPDELVAMVLLLVVAGHETTANTLSTGLYHLLENPSSLARLRDEPSLMPSAVEELVRYDAATRNTVARYATADVEVGEQPVRRGEKLFVGLHAANHDPAVFERPLELDLSRSPNRHIGFNIGPHFCLGAGLARMELQIALQALLDRYPSIELAGEVAWKPSFIIRGLESLPLRLSAT
jgi:cytochrome P450